MLKSPEPLQRLDGRLTLLLFLLGMCIAQALQIGVESAKARRRHRHLRGELNDLSARYHQLAAEACELKFAAERDAAEDGGYVVAARGSAVLHNETVGDVDEAFQPDPATIDECAACPSGCPTPDGCQAERHCRLQLPGHGRHIVVVIGGVPVMVAAEANGEFRGLHAIVDDALQRCGRTWESVHAWEIVDQDGIRLADVDVDQEVHLVADVGVRERADINEQLAKAATKLYVHQQAGAGG